jgi:hypothetical protein
MAYLGYESSRESDGVVGRHTEKCLREGGYSCICGGWKNQPEPARDSYGRIVVSGPKLSDAEHVQEKARLNGCFLIAPKKNELFIDIDTAEQLARFYRRFGTGWICWLVEPINFVINPSPSARPDHFHIVVTMHSNVWNLTRIFWQWVLGSDPKREWMSLIRWFRLERTPTLFFERAPKDGAYR